MRLASQLASRAESDVLVVGSSGSVLHVGDVAASRPSVSGQDATVSIATSDGAVAIAALIAADGDVGTIRLGSAHAPETGPDQLTVDSDDLASFISSLKHVSSTGQIDTQWLFSTSGTTGSRKIVAHPLRSLTRTVRASANAAARWGLLYEWSRFAGIQVILQSLASGATLLACDPSSPIDERIQFLVENDCTHLSATPTLWRLILMSPAASDLSLTQITLGGEIADQRTLDGLRSRFPDAQITHIFAATESGVGFSVHDGRAGFPASFLADPPSGIAMRVVDDRLHIANADVVDRYVGSDGVVADDGWVNTGDVVELHDDRYLFAGRGSSTLNVGGASFTAEALETALMGAPGVALARVVARDNAVLGQLAIAEIVPTADAPDTLAKDVRKWCAKNLERYMVPAKVHVVDEIPLNAAGKVDRSS